MSQTAVPPLPDANLLEGLTHEQHVAVQHNTGPLMIFAGPGAGKTRTITHRIAHLLASGQAQPTQIVAVTFTVAAAGEMRERVAAMLGTDATRGITLATFHSLCARLLRAHTDWYARSEDYTIYDPADMAKVVSALLADTSRTALQEQVAACSLPGSASKAPVGQILREISLAKNRLWTPKHYAANSRHPLAALIAAVWQESEHELEHSNAFDFDDLLVFTVKLLAEHPGIRTNLREHWPWLLVDEFQDTNYAQMALVSLLAGETGNVTVVADDDQLLYSFRGAEASNVLRFGDWFSAARHVTLGRNYRSRAEILRAAVSCVSHNTHRVEKNLIAERGTGGQVRTMTVATERHEAEAVAELIHERLDRGLDAPEILVLARSAHITVPIQQDLSARGIAYKVLGALGLFERAAIRDAVAYLRLLANAADGQAFRRAISSPRRGVGPATTNRIIQHGRSIGRPDLIAACYDAEAIDGIRRATTRQSVLTFGRHLRARRMEVSQGAPVGRVVAATLTMPGGLVEHYQRLKSEGDNDAEHVLEDLRALCRMANAYTKTAAAPATLSGFLETACGLDEAQQTEGDEHRLTISTIHRCKGMEASLVVLMGCEESVLPHWRSLQREPDTSGTPSGGLAEERRLFYVAATRAKDELVITGARRRDHRQTDGPSRFIAEAGL
jgi:DNA helicase-2/ATP-dependent DNA helicase PcrA